jgi:hypothetical protein
VPDSATHSPVRYRSFDDEGDVCDISPNMTEPLMTLVESPQTCSVKFLSLRGLSL